MKKLKKGMIYIFGGLFILIVVLVAGGKLFFRYHLPTIDGTVYAPAIRQETRVVRDQWGIPHISAQNGTDAFFAYGYTIAQDRLFQIEMQSRLARGELAEILGASFLKNRPKIQDLSLQAYRRAIPRRTGQG